MCAQLEVSRSRFYAWLERPPSAHALRDRELERRIGGHFEESAGIYGSPRIHALLRREGQRVGRKRCLEHLSYMRLFQVIVLASEQNADPHYQAGRSFSTKRFAHSGV